MSSSALHYDSHNDRADWNTVEPLGVYKPLTARSRAGQLSLRSPIIQPLGTRSLAVLQPQLFSSDSMMSGRLADEFGIDDINAGPGDVDSVGLGARQLEGEFGIDDTNIGPTASPLRDTIASASTTATPHPNPIQRQPQASETSLTLPDATGTVPTRSQSPVLPQSPNSSQPSGVATTFAANPPAMPTPAPQISEANPTNSASESIQPQRTHEASQQFAPQSSIKNIAPAPETKISQAPGSAPTAAPAIPSPATPPTSQTVQRQAITEASAIAPSTITDHSPSAAGAIPESRVFAPVETTSDSAPVNVGQQKTTTQKEIPPHKNSPVSPSNDSRSDSDRSGLSASDSVTEADSSIRQRSLSQEPTETTPTYPDPTPLQRQAIPSSSPTTGSSQSIERGSVQASDVQITSPSAAESVQSQASLEKSQSAALPLDTSPADDSLSAASPTEIIQATASVSSPPDRNAPSSFPTSIAPLENLPAANQPIARSLAQDAADPFDQSDNTAGEVVQDAVVQRDSVPRATVSNQPAATIGNREQGTENRGASDSLDIPKTSAQDSPADTSNPTDVLGAAVSLQGVIASETNAPDAIAGTPASNSTNTQPATRPLVSEGSVTDSSAPIIQRRDNPETTIPTSPQTVISSFDSSPQPRTDLETTRPTSPTEVPTNPSTAPPLQRTASPEAIADISPQTAMASSAMASSDSLLQQKPDIETTAFTSAPEIPTSPPIDPPLQRTANPEIHRPKPIEQRPEVSSDLAKILQPSSLTEPETAPLTAAISPAAPSPTSSDQLGIQAQQINRIAQATPIATPEQKATESGNPDLKSPSASPGIAPPATSAPSQSASSALSTDALTVEPTSPSESRTVQRVDTLKDRLENEVTVEGSAGGAEEAGGAAASVSTPASDVAVERPFLSGNKTLQRAVALPQVTQDLGVFTPLRSPLELNQPANISTAATEGIPNSFTGVADSGYESAQALDSAQPPQSPNIGGLQALNPPNIGGQGGRNHTAIKQRPFTPSIPDTAAAVNQTAPNAVPAWSTLEDLGQQAPAVDASRASGTAIQRQEATADADNEGVSDRAVPTTTAESTNGSNPNSSKSSTSSPEAWDSIAELLEQSTPPGSDVIHRAATSGSGVMNRAATSSPASDVVNRVATFDSGAMNRAATFDSDVVNRVATSFPASDAMNRAATSPLPAASAHPDPFPNLHALETPSSPIQRQTSPSRFTGSSPAMPIQRLAGDTTASTEHYETVSGASDDSTEDDASGQLEKLAQVMYQKVRQRLAIERERMGRSGSGRFQ
ncbi:MAG: hypothetical protein ACFBSF_05110 [Leptolyngbyaceae cyanobacterium]